MDIVNLALDVLGIQRGLECKTGMKKILQLEFLGAYELATCRIWMPLIAKEAKETQAQQEEENQKNKRMKSRES